MQDNIDALAHGKNGALALAIAIGVVAVIVVIVSVTAIINKN
jgi:hypothetical protein